MVLLASAPLLVPAQPGPAIAEADDVEVIDMSPAESAAWTPRYLIAPFVSIFRGPGYMYAPRRLEIVTTPPGGLVDLFYVRRGFQKRFEQAQTPVVVLLPSRLKADSRDTLSVRAFAEGYRQQRRDIKLGHSDGRLEIDLDPLPNTLEGVVHRYFNGRASLGFRTEEALAFRLQEADDGFAVIMNETALSPEAARDVGALGGPLITEAYGQQLGEDLMVKLVLAPAALGDDRDVRSRQRYDAPRDRYVFSIDLVAAAGEGPAIERALAALASLTSADVSGCALVFDGALRRESDRRLLDRALAPSGEFTDRYLRAAMRRLGELSVDGVVDFTDGNQFRPAAPIELEMAIGDAAGAKGYLALLRAFARAVESTPEAGREALRGLIAPEVRRDAFLRALEGATSEERACSQDGGSRRPS
jgi:hypothetical protein